MNNNIWVVTFYDDSPSDQIHRHAYAEAWEAEDALALAITSGFGAEAQSLDPHLIHARFSGYDVNPYWMASQAENCFEGCFFKMADTADPQEEEQGEQESEPKKAPDAGELRACMSCGAGELCGDCQGTGLCKDCSGKQDSWRNLIGKGHPCTTCRGSGLTGTCNHDDALHHEVQNKNLSEWSKHPYHENGGDIGFGSAGVRGPDQSMPETRVEDIPDERKNEFSYHLMVKGPECVEHGQFNADCFDCIAQAEYGGGTHDHKHVYLDRDEALRKRDEAQAAGFRTELSPVKGKPRAEDASYSTCSSCKGGRYCGNCGGKGYTDMSDKGMPTTCGSCNGRGMCGECQGMGRTKDSPISIAPPAPAPKAPRKRKTSPATSPQEAPSPTPKRTAAIGENCSDECPIHAR